MSYVPDRVIVRKLKEYDPYLYVKWNNKDQYFEVWREMPHGSRLITPVTQSIYDIEKPIEFTPLDERILWWIVKADPERVGGRKRARELFTEQYIAYHKRMREQKKRLYRDFAKDTYHSVNNFYFTKKSVAQKQDVKVKTWVRPDSVGISSPRVVSRSKGNALLYNYQRKR